VFAKGKVDISEFTGLLRETYTENGVFVRAGTKITRPKLADTLDIIAEEGADAFYTGNIAQSIVNAVRIVSDYNNSVHITIWIIW